jgi:hypothetical protein
VSFVGCRAEQKIYDVIATLITGFLRDALIDGAQPLRKVPRGLPIEFGLRGLCFPGEVSDLQQERANECGRRDPNPLTRGPGHRTGLPTSVIAPTQTSGGIRFRTAFRGGADTKCARMRGRLLYEYTP